MSQRRELVLGTYGSLHHRMSLIRGTGVAGGLVERRGREVTISHSEFFRLMKQVVDAPLLQD